MSEENEAFDQFLLGNAKDVIAEYATSRRGTLGDPYGTTPEERSAIRFEQARHTTVHFIDEHNLHYEALAWKTIDGDFANLYVWAHGHIRLIDKVPYSNEMTRVSWHAAHIDRNGWSHCQSNAGYILLSEEERETFHRLAFEVAKEQEV